MQYFTAYYRQSETGSLVSVLLQQVYHKKRKLPVILACIGEEGDIPWTRDAEPPKESRELLYKLSDWFYGTGLSLCSRPGERGMTAAADSLLQRLYEIRSKRTQLTACRLTGILCVGQRVLLFWQGEQQFRLLNIRNHRPYCQELQLGEQDEDGVHFQLGTIQRGAAVLLATKGFNGCLSAQKRQECLNVREIHSQEQSERRLKELGLCCEAEKGNGLGAVLIVAG